MLKVETVYFILICKVHFIFSLKAYTITLDKIKTSVLIAYCYAETGVQAHCVTSSYSNHTFRGRFSSPGRAIGRPLDQMYVCVSTCHEQ